MDEQKDGYFTTAEKMSRATLIMWNLLDMMRKQMMEGKSFRLEMDYKAETNKADFRIIREYAEEDTDPGSSG